MSAIALVRTEAPRRVRTVRRAPARFGHPWREAGKTA